MRQRSQALRSIIGLRRDNGEEITVPQAGNQIEPILSYSFLKLQHLSRTLS